MAEKYILDIHTLFWYLTASPKLSRKAKDISELDEIEEMHDRLITGLALKMDGI